MYSEDDLLPLSGLQHMAFCERQWALIHIEQQWEENPLTAEGRVLHEHVHEAGSETRKTLVVVRGLPLHNFGWVFRDRPTQWSFARQSPAIRAAWRSTGGPTGGCRRQSSTSAASRRNRSATWSKSARRLCASKRCSGLPIPAGALFYAAPRRRQEVAFTPQLRAQTERLCARMQDLYGRRETPPPVYTKGCENCSLKNICLPRTLAVPRDVRAYLAAAMKE